MEMVIFGTLALNLALISVVTVRIMTPVEMSQYPYLKELLKLESIV